MQLRGTGKGCGGNFPKIMSAVFCAIMIVGALVLPLTIVGMIDAPDA